MPDDGWYYCLTHHRVEPAEGCKAIDRLGPYRFIEEAEHALDKVAERNDDWDATDDWGATKPSD